MRTFILLILLFLSLPVCGNAQTFDSIQDIHEFQVNNPDGKKYEFVKKYLSGLGYLQRNSVYNDAILEYAQANLDGEKKVKEVIDQLVRDNVNLRIARNMIKDYRDPQNGLILKVTDLFMSTCEQQVVLNNSEIDLLKKIYVAYQEDTLSDLDRKDFKMRQKMLVGQRKESLQNFLEASILTGKVLISSELDENGKLVKLGITGKQRKKLIEQINYFAGKGFEGTLRDGQTFLEASVSVIREVLEDEHWFTLDG